MASVRVVVFVVFTAILLLNSLVQSKDDAEDHLLQGLNSFRSSANVAPLSKNKKATCLAEEVADKLEDQPCSGASNNGRLTLEDYPELLSKCGIDINRTRDGAVLPVCVPDLVPTLVLMNYTHRPQYARLLNDSRFIGTGVGKEEDWMVVVLATDSPAGDFAGAFRLIGNVGFGLYLVCFVLGVLVYLV